MIFFVKTRRLSLWTFAFTACFTSAFAAEVSPIFPEDGSMRSGTWWVSPVMGSEFSEREAAEKILASHGIRLKTSAFKYRYLQDVLLFDSEGNVLIQAEMEKAGDDVLDGLTVGVYDSEDRRLQRYTEKDAAVDGRPSRKMRGTLSEGGALITGRFENGETYAILPIGTVTRTQKFLGISEEEARSVVANDFGIRVENLVTLSPIAGHLDLSLQAFPGGVILVHDPSLVVGTLKEALADPQTEWTERELVLEMLSMARNEPDHYHQTILDKNAKTLEERGFRVIRVAGRFLLPQDWLGGRRGIERVNFLNGTVGRGARDELFVLTNRARQLPSLQRAWVRTLSKQLSLEEKNIHFIGTYFSGAGLDCIGVIAP